MSEYLNYLKETLEVVGPISLRPMFGGHGVFHDGLMIGLVTDDELYLKADRKTQPQFADRDLTAFEYNKNGKVMKMSYFQAPEDIYDNPEEARRWAQLAFAAALRAKQNK